MTRIKGLYEAAKAASLQNTAESEFSRLVALGLGNDRQLSQLRTPYCLDLGRDAAALGGEQAVQVVNA